MILLSPRPLRSFEGACPLRATRDGYGEALLELGRSSDQVLVLESDLARSTRTEWWMEEFPERFFNCGIAEQNMIGMAAGLASVGFVPFATTYSIFIGRAYDQIRQSVAYARRNVKIAGSHSGFAASFDGGSHQGLEDLALMSVLPGMVVLSPLDFFDTKAAVALAAAIEGPVYLRFQKEPSPAFTSGEAPLAVGRTLQWGTGTDIALVATGSRVHDCLAAAARLEQDGVGARVLGIGVIKPFDDEAVRVTAAAVRRIVTVEEHMVHGGLYSAVCAAAAPSPCPVLPIAATERFGETGSWAELLRVFQMDADGIEAFARKNLNLDA